MPCQDCEGLNRREFLTAASAGTVAAAAGLTAPRLQADTSRTSETVVAQLYNSLSPEQKSKVTFPVGHELQNKVDANWYITPEKVGTSYTADQQAMIREIFTSLHNPEFVDKVFQHIKDDAGSLDDYSIALFGEPGTGSFEFVLAGRHCTVRCDGDSEEGAAFGGPIFYGHAAGTFNEKPDHPGNVYWYQAKRANEVFQALDGKQRQQALLGDPRAERGAETVRLKGQEALAGLPVRDMSRDQRELVDRVLGDLLLPFREKDTAEAMRYIHANGGVEGLVMSFYKNLDVGGDGVWDVWQLESPKMVWYFRGSPHVHTWVNIRG